MSRYREWLIYICQEYIFRELFKKKTRRIPTSKERILNFFRRLAESLFISVKFMQLDARGN